MLDKNLFLWTGVLGGLFEVKGCRLYSVSHAGISAPSYAMHQLTRSVTGGLGCQSRVCL